MKKALLLTSVGSLAAVLSTVPAFAQSDLIGTRVVSEGIDDVQTSVNRDMSRSSDALRFGPEYNNGINGSVSLTYAGRSGNSDSQDFTLGGRLTSGQGNFVQSVGLLLEYGENDDGSKDKQNAYAIYDGNYYFNNSLYGFGLGRIKTDGLATGTDRDRDAFLGFGVGYRVVNTPDTTWRVQAGPGVSYTRVSGTGEETTELGGIASSRVYHRFNENIFLTNDTDVLTSDTAGLRATNDLGVNFKMTDAFATRVSYLTEYEENREIRSDNKLGVSLVFGF
jgi:putative salt-induced outer membrane protein